LGNLRRIDRRRQPRLADPQSQSTYMTTAGSRQYQTIEAAPLLTIRLGAPSAVASPISTDEMVSRRGEPRAMVTANGGGSGIHLQFPMHLSTREERRLRRRAVAAD